jgi:catechol 2,3-dioxygenase-like lactoylglutathione lyase family enzyme
VSHDPVRLDHLAFGVADVARVAPFLAGTLGGRPRGAGPGMGFRFWQWEFAGGAAIEVIAPDGPPGGFVHRFLERRGPGVHHLTFKVPELRAAMERAEAQGFEVVGFDDTWPSWKEAFLHPRQAQGIVVQLAESHPELETPPTELFPFPPAPPHPSPPVRIVGLRMAARSEERARRQWQALLGGTCRARGRSLAFRWPESPLRVAVDVDPAAPEGPRVVEVAAGRPLALPEGPHPELGVPFAVVERELEE